MRIRTLILSSLLATAASACVITPYRTRAVVVESTDDGEEIVVVETAPPAAYAEVATPAPYAGALWVDGYWGWSGHRHAWVAGRWERPRTGYIYRPHRWVHHHGRWHLHAGGWVRHHRG